MATCVIECAPELNKQQQNRVVGVVRGGSTATTAASGSGGGSAATSLRQPQPLPLPISTATTKIMPRTEMQIIDKPGTSSSSAFLSSSLKSTTSSSFNDELMLKLRGKKRSSASMNWTDDDNTAATILSMASRFSTASNISSSHNPKPFNSTIPMSQLKISSSSTNDPTDVLLHQLSQVCEQAAQKSDPSQSNNNIPQPTIRTVLESDKNSSTLKSTKLANHFISCFVVGGEIRLCSPQIYAIIMKDVHEDDLAHWIREYFVIDHMSSPEQILSLKQNRAIPPESGTCGLMTKTNAERLVGALVDPVNYRTLPNDKKDKFDPILIQHDCFGGCEARLYTALYPGPCVECIQCQCLMTTESFCRHSHIHSSSHSISSNLIEKNSNELICHWGFDSANWSKYIRLHDLAERDSESIEKFYYFIKNHTLQGNNENNSTLEENLEYLVSKKSMLSTPIGALAAAQLLAAQQQQHYQNQNQQQQQASTSSAGGGLGIAASSAPSSLQSSSAFHQSTMPMSSSSSQASGQHGIQQQHSPHQQISSLLNSLPSQASNFAASNIAGILQLLNTVQQQRYPQQNNDQNQQLFEKLQASIASQQPQPSSSSSSSTAPARTPTTVAAGPSSSSSNNLQQQNQSQSVGNGNAGGGSMPPLNVVLAALMQHHRDQQQQQFQSTINSFRNNIATNNDDSEIPRKRAHTISDPSANTIIRQKPDEALPLNPISFGMLPTDQPLIRILSSLDSEVSRQIIDQINLAISARMNPILEENIELKRKLAESIENGKARDTLLAQAAAQNIQHRISQQHQQNHFPTPSSSSTSSSYVHPRTLANIPSSSNINFNGDHSDIEIDDE